MRAKTHLKVNDQVEVIAGKDKGRVGKVIKGQRDRWQSHCRKDQHDKAAYEAQSNESAGRNH